MRAQQRRRLFIIDAASGLVQPVALDLDEHVANPVWSPDGESLVFVSTSAQGPRLWRLQLDASTPQPVSGPGWFEVIETPEGVFATNRNEPGIWRLEPGRAPELVLSGFRSSLDNAVLETQREWAVANGRFYIMDRSVEGRARILSRAIAGGPMTRVADVDGVLSGSLAVDPTTGDVVYRVGVEEQYDIAVIPYRRR